MKILDKKHIFLFFLHCLSQKWHREVPEYSDQFHLLHYQLQEKLTIKWTSVRNRGVYLIFLQNICWSKEKHLFLSKKKGDGF